jgi:hypothetical protein
MRNISQMAKGMTPQQMVQLAGRHSPKPIGKPKFVSDETAKIVNDLFVELQGIVPGWRYTFPSNEELNNAKRSWIKGFMEEGINSLNQIELGLRKARASQDAFWPSVGKFMAWCKPTAEDLGLPSKEDAYREVIANLGEFSTTNWSHPAVPETVKKVKSYPLKNLSEKELRALFYHYYAIIVEDVRGGENLPVETPKAITTEPEHRPAPPEVEQGHLADMKKMFV